jgi:hypothetical protein
LPEVPLLKEESDPHQGHAQIFRTLEMVPRQNPQTPRVDREGLTDPELHAEVGHLRKGPSGVLHRKPSLGAIVLRPQFVDLGKSLQILLVLSQRQKVGHGDGLKDQPGVLRQRPESRIETVPELVRPVIPCPAKIKG